MGQPYIELRHRAPDHRLRHPFPLPAAPDPGGLLLHHRDPHLCLLRPGQGARLGEAPLGPHMVMAASVEQLNPHHLGQNNEAALSGADGIEEHLEGVESAVKDLEDVEVKDLVDLNLNLDAEDGRNTQLRTPLALLGL